MRVPDLDTPALVVDAQRLEANLARMAEAAARAGVDLSPHAKTHKSLPIAKRQLAHGAARLTVATLDEAELFAAGGCEQLFIAYPLWAGGVRAARVRDLHERVSLRVGVDSVAAAERLAVVTRGAPLSVLVEVECGARRTGVAPESVAELALACIRLGLRVVGAFSHPGHAYHAPDGVAAAAADEREALSVAGRALAGILDDAPELSGGSTPTALDGLSGPLTEARPGTYVFGDRQQMHLSGVAPEDVALVVAARVVSTPRPGEAVLDAGSKTLSADRPAWLGGYGHLPAAPEASIDALTEEHAVIRGLDRPFSVGDLVQVIPNHVCSAVNLGRELVVVSAGEIVDRWPIGSPVARRRPAEGG